MEAESSQLGRGFIWSMAFHLGLVVFVVFKSIFFRAETKPYVPSLRVDLVGLPDLLKKDVPKSVPAVTPKAKKVKKKKRPKPKSDEMVVNNRVKRKKKLQSALDRIKAIDKVEDDVDEVPPIKGNLLSPGTSLSGDARETATRSYYDQVLERIKANWTLPVWIARKDLSAQVEIFIDARGRLQGLRFKKYSGDPQFDDAVRKAISRSQPFAPPPSGIKRSVLYDGILLGFPL